MKKIVTLLMLLLAFAANAQTLKLKAGSVLTYKVTNAGQSYVFTVTLKSWEPDRSFDYDMGEPANLKGNVTLTAGALANATGQVNMFSGGPLSLTDRTTVWLSKTVFNSLKTEFQARVSVDGGTPITLLNNYEDKYNVPVDGKDTGLNIIYAEEQSGKPYHYWILNDAENPLIVKMELGWTIELTEIKQ